MNSLKLRRLLIHIHLYLAGFLAPGFLLVAFSGALYLAQLNGGTQSTPIALPANITLDSASPSIEEDVRAVLKQAGVDVRFEYIRGRGDRFMTRPTTRDFVVFENGPDGLNATLESPSFTYAMMELHKGHGPRIFRMYSIVAGIALFLVVLGGLAVGLLAKNYRRPTLISTGIGAVIFIVLGFVL
ncbi:MAG: PepSY-associated TM helix domain-containing protein [Hyphomonas sp.]